MQSLTYKMLVFPAAVTDVAISGTPVLFEGLMHMSAALAHDYTPVSV